MNLLLFDAADFPSERAEVTLTDRARFIGHEVESEVRSKLEGRRWRRVGLLVFWFYLIVTLGALVRFRRRALRTAGR